jgi:dihydroxyacid dehydratase/phosphogluconate dehydratase
LNKRTVDLLVSEEELGERRKKWIPPDLEHKTPWEEIYRSMVGQNGTGACLEPAVRYVDIIEIRGESRHNH